MQGILGEHARMCSDSEEKNESGNCETKQHVEYIQIKPSGIMLI